MKVKDYDLGAIGIVRGGGKNFYGLVIEGRTPNTKGVLVIGETLRIGGGDLSFFQIEGAEIVIDITSDTLVFDNYEFVPGDVRLRDRQLFICVENDSEPLEVNSTNGEVLHTGSGVSPKVYGFKLVRQNRNMTEVLTSFPTTS